MPVQEGNSNFAKRHGARLSAANAKYRGKPIETGNRRLPAGIRNGIAKLSTMYTKVQDKDDSRSKTPKGEYFFRASAIVMTEEFKGERISGMITQVVIPLCDVAPTEYKPAGVSFEENWNTVRSLFVSLGIQEPSYDDKNDPTGELTYAYYVSAMKTLTDPKRPPVYIEFETTGFTPRKSPSNPNPTEIVKEIWLGRAEWNGRTSPGVGVTEGPPRSAQPDPNSLPPQTLIPAQSRKVQPATPDEVKALLEVAVADPDGNTEEGKKAHWELEDLAHANGWSKEATDDAGSWAEVGEMALTAPDGIPVEAPDMETPNPTEESETPKKSTQAPILGQVTVGSKWKYAKRDKSGARFTDANGQEFPAVDVEVTSIDLSNKTCTLRYSKDGKDVIDLRTRTPFQVKWEWLDK